MNRKQALLLGTSLVLIVGAGTWKATHAMAADQGQLAPDFTLSHSDTGKPFRLADTRGKVRIINFWATWCPPCRAEIPSFVSLYKQYKGKGLEIVGVSVDEDGAKAVNPFMKAHGMNYPVVLADMPTVQAYGGIRGIPNTFVVDRKGHIVKHYVGAPGSDEAAIRAEFEKDIKPLL